MKAWKTTSGTPSCEASSIAGLDVLPAGVDAAVGDQAEQVQPAARAVAAPLAGGEQGLVLEEAAVGDRVVDPGQVLLDDRAGAEVEVADLGVAHLPSGRPTSRPWAESWVCG